VKEREQEETRRRREEEARGQWERDAMAWVAPITRERRNSKPILPMQNSNSRAEVHNNGVNNVTKETLEETARREKEARRRQKERENTQPLLEPEIVIETLCAHEAADALLLGGGEGGVGQIKATLEARRKGQRLAVKELPVQRACEEGVEDDAREEVFTLVADGSKATERAFSPLIDCSFVRLNEARHQRALHHCREQESGLQDEKEATSAKLYGTTCARCGTRMLLVSRAFKTYAFLIDEDIFVCEDAKCGLQRKYVRVVDVLK
jgi:hypothetical protein